jgi:RNA polymerase sigma-70 factor (family 1)
MTVDKSIFRDEDELLLKLQNGDQQAFNIIFKHFYAALCFFASRLTSDKYAAEEIVQDIFYKLWEKHGDFNSITSIKAFLYISTRNACMNHIDKEQRKVKREMSAFSSNFEELDEPVITGIIYAEVLNEIRTEINSLPEQCAKIIKMLFEDEMKPQEIADELHITVSTVYNQKMRGISLLKKRLSGATFELLMIYLVFKGYR